MAKIEARAIDVFQHVQHGEKFKLPGLNTPLYRTATLTKIDGTIVRINYESSRGKIRGFFNPDTPVEIEIE